MSYRSSNLQSLPGALVRLVVLCLAMAGTGRAETWNLNANGNWNTGGNWTPGTVPNAIGATATFGSIITANRTITVNANITLGTLDINDNNNYTLSRTAGGGTNLLTFDAVGAGPATINISNSGSPTISTTGDRLRVNLTDNTVINNTGTGLFSISTIVQGAGSLTHSGTGTTLLSGVNTFSGGLTINGGTMRFGNNGANGTGTLTLNGGAIQASGAARTLNEAVVVGGNFAVGGTLAFTLSGTMDLGSAVRTVTVNNTALTTFSGVASGTGGITKAGAGTLSLSGSNTYTGATTVNAGTLRALAAGTAFGNNSAVTLANVAGATLDLAGFNTSIGSLAGGGATGGNVTLGAGTLTTGGDNSSTTFAGIISGTGGLVKTGSGTQTLTGANTYTGATTVSGGQLALMGSTAGGSVAINVGGTLSGTGTAGGLTTISGQHAPGTQAAPVGTQTFSAGLTYAAGSTLSWDLAANSTAGPGTNFDQVLVTGGNLTITAGSNLSLVFNGAGSSVLWSDTFWDADRSWTFIQNSGAGTTTGLFTTVTPSFDSSGALLATLHPTASFAVAQVGNNVVLNYAAIPEPSTVGLLIVASVITGTALFRRRRVAAC